MGKIDVRDLSSDSETLKKRDPFKNSM